jgi:hypothetical protein
MGRHVRRLCWLSVLLGGGFDMNSQPKGLDDPSLSWKTKQYIDTVDPLTVHYPDCQDRLN